jgi:adenylate cyclase class 2
VLEIELKAWSDDLEAVRRRLVRLAKKAKKPRPVVKEDVYFCPPGIDPARCDQRRDALIRVRIEDGKAVVTGKRKKIERGVETSEEIELAVDDASALRRFVDYLGYRPFLEKRKESRSYVWSRGVTVELNRVKGLGDFVEIEALVPDGAPAKRVEAARDRLRAILAALGIPESRIEGRPYMELLRGKAR